MHGCVTRQSLQLEAGIYKIFNLGIAVVRLPQLLAYLQRLGESHAKLTGYHLGYRIASRIGQIQRPAHIADDALCLQRTECDDLRHAVLAVLFHHIVYDLLALLIAKVHVDIGHGDSLGIEKALEKQLISDRIYIGDAHAVRYYASCRRATARSHGDIMSLGIVDIVPDYEEVVHIAHLPDDLQLIGKALLKLLISLRIASLKALTAQRLKIFKGIRILLGDDIFRQLCHSELYIDIAAHGYLMRSLQSVGNI